MSLARDGRLGEAAADAVAVADGARPLSSGEREGLWSPRTSIWRTQSITHVTVILRIASFYTRGSQRRPGAQQPETDGVRAQRLGLRFAASVAAVLALAVVRSSLARAHGLARVPRHTTQALPAVRMRCSLPPV